MLQEVLDLAVDVILCLWIGYWCCRFLIVGCSGSFGWCSSLALRRSSLSRLASLGNDFLLILLANSLALFVEDFKLFLGELLSSLLLLLEGELLSG